MLIDQIRAMSDIQTQPTILVVGDLMLDHYVFGAAERLSPEAPVPIVNVHTDTQSLGGAANVALNLKVLGANVMLLGLIGDDESGDKLKSLLTDKSISTASIVTDKQRPTTLKMRIIANNSQLVRVDREITSPITCITEDILLAKADECIDDVDIVILSDYNKGVFSPSFTKRFIQLSKQKKKRVIVDPKGLNYCKYQGAYLIKPNRKEFLQAANIERINNKASIQEAARSIFSQTDAQYLIVTLSEEGMMVITPSTNKLLPVKATAVYDVTGAGDTVLSSIAYFIALGFNVSDACEIANHAAAIVVRRIGCSSVSKEEILDHMNAQ